MSENISMTRISDLPEMPTQQYIKPSENHSFNDSSNIYIPLNPHPNPYGVADQIQNGTIPPVSKQEPIYNQPHEVQSRPRPQRQQPPQPLQPPQQPPQPLQPLQPQIESQLQPEYRLPQRDIPMDITNFTHDEQIQPNYIPKPKLTSDYVERHEQATQSKIREYEEEKQKEAEVNQWIDQLYQPLLLCILYFMFQLPILNTLIFKRFSFLSIYKNDGNFNIFGLIFKSILFAFVFFIIQKSTKYLIDFVASI